MEEKKLMNEQGEKLTDEQKKKNNRGKEIGINYVKKWKIKKEEKIKEKEKISLNRLKGFFFSLFTLMDGWRRKIMDGQGKN